MSATLETASSLMNSSCQVVDADWPEAWYMVKDEEVKNQKMENRLTPNKKVSVEEMKNLGLQYWKMDAENYAYPIKSIPWDPSEATDPRLAALRDERGYSYADVLTIHPDHLPNFDTHVKNFFTEHIHDAEEIRYILGGSGFFDVRDPCDAWIRVHVKKGDLMTLPEGIYHRFTCDEVDNIHAMRMFIGVPCWTPINRFDNPDGIDTDTHASRKKYICMYCMPFLEKLKQDVNGTGTGTGEEKVADNAEDEDSKKRKLDEGKEAAEPASIE